MAAQAAPPALRTKHPQPRKGDVRVIYSVAIVIVIIPIAIVSHGIGILLILPVFLVLAVLHLVYLILGAVKAGQGELYRVPAFICFRMVR
jgi:uncharacterized Tic20 family protein